MKRKIMSFILAAATASTVLVGLTACNRGGGPTDFTWYLTETEDGYYRGYEDNPVLEYISENVQFEGEDGELKNITFDFTIPASTEEARSDFNNKYISGNWENILDPTMGSITELYESDVIVDLTEYVTDPEIMPNLSGYLEENPDVAELLQVNTEDGRKYLSIPGINDALDSETQDFGFNYRRDLLVKYGTQPATFFDPMKDDAPQTNPNAGKIFSGHYTLNEDGSERSDPMSQNTALPDGADGDSWVDDVVFPSGNTDPVYISDWQWMFEIFEAAYADMGVTDNYMMSLFYPGYNANGDLSSGFGGGGVLWYKDEDNNCVFGATEDGFRAYLECMNNWYNKGWLDRHFNENADAAFYEIDIDQVAQGNIPLWMGAPNLGTRLQRDGDLYENASEAVVYLAATPINDIPAYDGDPGTTAYTTQATASEASSAMGGGEGSDYMLQIPTCVYQNELFGQGFVVTKETAEEKDMILLMHFFDYLFGEEGSVLATMGLTKEQYEATENEVYEDYGLTDGAYTANADGTYTYASALEDDLELRSAATGVRLPGIKCKSEIKYTYPETYQNNRAQWVKYEATGWIGGTLNGQRTTEEADTIETVRSAVENNYMYLNVYKFITGETALTDANWRSFCSSVANYTYTGVSVADATAAYQTVFDRLYGADSAAVSIQ